MSTKLFNTHHSPVGAWASLTFGVPGTPLSIDLQEPNVKKTGTMMVGWADSKNIRSIGFADEPKNNGQALTAEGDKEKKKSRFPSMSEMYNMANEEEISRTLTPSKDILSCEEITFTTYTPYSALPDPEKETIREADCLPGILMDITIDNTQGEEDKTAFFGYAHVDFKKVYAMDLEESCGIRFRNEWSFNAQKTEGTYMIRGLDAPMMLRSGARVVSGNGPAMICMPVPKGEKKTLSIVWTVYASDASNGSMVTRYFYNRYFSCLDEAIEGMFKHEEEIRSRAQQVDEELLHSGQDQERLELFCQSVRSYYASSQLIEEKDDTIHWNIGEGAYIWRNTMDLCADHITWELRRNPWIVRSLMDDYLNYYTYVDQVSYPGKEGMFPGGISFTHDMGCYFTYSRKGYSAYERVNDSERGFYFYMTTEELLNGIYCIIAYVMKTGDVEWLAGKKDLLEQLMTSLENRDGACEEERNGVLKACSSRSGGCELESTTYDALDHSLLKAAGNVYVYIKTWCSLVLMKKAAQLLSQPEVEKRAEAMLAKCRQSAALFVSEENPWLKANAYFDIPGAVAAAVEPLAVLDFLGIDLEAEEKELVDLLKKHAEACMKDGVCCDSVSGGLRLSSTSRNTWPSKSVLTLYAMEKILKVAIPDGMVHETVMWAQESAKTVTIADQIFSDTRELVGAPYYPRIVTSALWI